jgi:hypothetical protein
MTTTNQGAVYAVTEYCPKDEIITVILKGEETRMTYCRWLDHEIDRWNNKWERRDCWIQEDKKTGHIALCSWMGYYKAMPEGTEDAK